MMFQCYRRGNGTFGVRNHLLVFPTVLCANAVAEKISLAVPGSVYVSHPLGCGHLGADKEHVMRSMAGYCSNPNVGGVLLVGLGCELITPETLAPELSRSGQRFQMVSIQECGGTLKTVEKGRSLASALLEEIGQIRREPAEISRLTMGVKCGGSDTLSGLTANPALGVAADLLVEHGGTVLLSEVPEMLGAEEVLAKRAATPEVRRRIFEITRAMEDSILKMGVDVRGSEPSPGNIAGGLTTLEEKSLGAILKGGTTPIVEVVPYGARPEKKGLAIMDGPALDAVVLSGFSSAGAQVMVFTTGRGSPLGSAIAPVVKVATNSQIYARMPDNIDINAGTIVEGTETLREKGRQILEEVLAAASGKETASEKLGHREFAIHTLGPTL